MQSQHSTHFPTQAWDSILKNRKKVEELANVWTWGVEDLKYTSVEAPVRVKERLVQEAVYRPVLSLASVRNKGTQLRNMGVLEEGQKIQELFGEDGEMIVSLCGEVQMEVPLVWRARRRGREGGLFAMEEDGRAGATRMLTEQDVEGIEEELQELAKDILMEWNRRQQQSALDIAVYTAFGTQFQWAQDKERVLELGVKAVVSLEHIVVMRKQLCDILDLLPDAVAERFSVEEMLRGYSSFLKLSTKLLNEKFEQHQIYCEWYKVRGKVYCRNFVFLLFRLLARWTLTQAARLLPSSSSTFKSGYVQR